MVNPSRECRAFARRQIARVSCAARVRPSMRKGALRHLLLGAGELGGSVDKGARVDAPRFEDVLLFADGVEKNRMRLREQVRISRVQRVDLAVGPSADLQLRRLVEHCLGAKDVPHRQGASREAVDPCAAKQLPLAHKAHRVTRFAIGLNHGARHEAFKFDAIAQCMNQLTGCITHHPQLEEEVEVVVSAMLLTK
eukprot:579936-Prymnesium_polylepis.3